MKEGKEKSWSDPRSGGGGYSDIDRYRARDGFNDVLMMLSNPRDNPRHWTGEKFAKGFYLKCLEEGPEGECCKIFGKPSTHNSVYVLHVAERKGNGKWNVIGKPKVWGFSDKTRCEKIYPIFRDFCGGDDKEFHKTLLMITCVNQDFQDVSIIPYNGKDVKVTKEMMELAKEKKDMFTAAISIDREDILNSISRLTGGSVSEASSEDVLDEPNKKESSGGDKEEQEEVGEVDLEKELDDFVTNLGKDKEDGEK